MDDELSTQVCRTITLSESSYEGATQCESAQNADKEMNGSSMRVSYVAATNRLLRVAVNGFFESLGVVLHVIQDLDVDTLSVSGSESLHTAQGIEDNDVRDG